MSQKRKWIVAQCLPTLSDNGHRYKHKGSRVLIRQQRPVPHKDTTLKCLPGRFLLRTSVLIFITHTRRLNVHCLRKRVWWKAKMWRSGCYSRQWSWCWWCFCFWRAYLLARVVVGFLAGLGKAFWAVAVSPDSSTTGQVVDVKFVT